MNHFVSQEDIDDFEQERQIQIWLQNHKQGRDVAFDYKYVSGKGTARNSRVRASLSLDQKITLDGRGTFADIIAGSDGRDLACGEAPEPNHIILTYLSALLGEGELAEWVLKTLKSWITTNETLFQTSPIDSDWERL